MWSTTDDEAHCLSHLLTSVTQTAGRRNTCHFLSRWKVWSESHRPCILPHSWHQQQKHLWRVCKLNTKLWSLILAHLKAFSYIFRQHVGVSKNMQMDASSAKQLNPGMKQLTKTSGDRMFSNAFKVEMSRDEGLWEKCCTQRWRRRAEA